MKLLKKKTVGEILMERGAISKSQLDIAMKFHESARKSGESLVEHKVVSPDGLTVILDLLLAEILVGMGYVDERDIFGSSRISVASGSQNSQSISPHDNENCGGCSDF